MSCPGQHDPRLWTIMQHFPYRSKPQVTRSPPGKRRCETPPITT
jgi:hypothetical protein